MPGEIGQRLVGPPLEIPVGKGCCRQLYGVVTTPPYSAAHAIALAFAWVLINVRRFLLALPDPLATDRHLEVRFEGLLSGWATSTTRCHRTSSVARKRLGRRSVSWSTPQALVRLRVGSGIASRDTPAKRSAQETSTAVFVIHSDESQHPSRFVKTLEWTCL